MDIQKKLEKEFNLKSEYATAIIELIDGGNTIPFIARYRKEQTGSIDDQVLREFADRLAYLRNLEVRREEVRSSIEALDKMDDIISAALAAAVTLAEVEDIYKPFKKKRKTRASVAREKGLEPLAMAMLLTKLSEDGLLKKAAEFIDAEKGVADENEAIAGACDIIAGDISDNPVYKKEVRRLTFVSGAIVSTASKKGLSEPESVYKLYYDFNEPLKRVAKHRVLAINRGEKEDYLSVSVNCDEQLILGYLCTQMITDINAGLRERLTEVVKDAYKRLIAPSAESETRSTVTEGAEVQAIKMFALNLKQLIMQPPLKGHTVLGFDPAYRTGCKLAVIDSTGKVLDVAVIYPTPPQSKTEEAKRFMLALIDKYNIGTIAIGNGTASKESEIFVADVIKQSDKTLQYSIVSEAGASVYSASKLGAEEFPQFDVSLRSAVSIARRLEDPLAEIVKIDPKAIGVGQYQHDMPQKELDSAVRGVVEDCVNAVGVDVNTASYSLLSYVSGIDGTLAKNIVAYREDNGSFLSRKALKGVPRMGARSYEQCAGFLRVIESEQILDNTGVHPESYKAAEKILKVLEYNFNDIKHNKIGDIKKRADIFGTDRLAKEADIGLPTLNDILDELLKPGRDPRDMLPPALLRSDVMDIKDLQAGMTFVGTVRNVVDFGAFIDIGVHQDGLVHVSKISNEYIKHPSEILKVGDIVNIKITEVDIQRKRIALSMID